MNGALLAIDAARFANDYRGAAMSLLTASSILRRDGRVEEARLTLGVAADFVLRAAEQPTPYTGGGPWLHDLWQLIDAARSTQAPLTPSQAG